MQVSVKTTRGLERRMQVQVPAERIDNEVDQRLKKVGKTAKLKGFRPGKAPMTVIRQHYGSEVRKDVLGEVMQETYAEAIGKEKLRPATSPKIETDVVGQGEDLQYTAIFEVYPEIKIKGLSRIKIKKPAVEIVAEDIDRMIDKLRRQRADWSVVERAAGEGDRVIVDFTGRIDGEVFAGGSGEKVPVVCGEGQMLSDFEKGLIGIVAGETRTIPVTFLADYHAADLAGQKAEFEASCSAVEEQVLPELDDEFCAAFGIKEGGIEKLRAEVRGNMSKEVEQKIQSDMKNQLLDQLLEANPIDIPKALVDEEIDSMRRAAMERMSVEDHAEAPPRETFEEQAGRRVTLGLLIKEAISSQELQVDQTKMTEKLNQIAAGYDDPEQVVQSYKSNPGMMVQLEMMVLEQQAVDWMLEQAKQSDDSKSFSEMMSFNA